MRQLTILPQQQSNHKVSFEQYSKVFDGFLMVQKGFYYPYNHEIQDKGWGCAWRAIQMFLSFYELDQPFQKLFNEYGRKEKLLSILADNKMHTPEVISQLKECKWSPQQSEYNWAQPFICQIISRNLGVKTKLLSVGGFCKSGFAPQFVFEDVVSFEVFWKMLKNHFSQGGPVMIDDGSIAMTIIGCKESSENDFHLVIADPHIGSNRKTRDTGVYEVILGKQGQLKSYHLTPEQIVGTEPSTAYQRIDFKIKPWMVTIAEL